MKFLLNLFLLLCLFCPKKEYVINETQYTKTVNAVLYLDLAAIHAINKQNITWVIDTKKTIYIEAGKSLQMKRGWTLKGKTGKELMMKEASNFSSAISLKNVDKVTLKDFNLSSTTYTPIESKRHQAALIDIDNFGLGPVGSTKGGWSPITVDNLTLSNHYSAIWIKRGRKIKITNCKLTQNAHQINLGCLTCDSLNIQNYRVHDVTIKDNEIVNGRGFGRPPDSVNTNGIKTLSNCTKIKIENNLIKKNNGDGIDLFPGGVSVLIKNNTIDSNRVNGIEVKMLNSFLPSQTGQIREVLIEDNLIRDNRETGIICLRDMTVSYYAQGIRIMSNTILNSGHWGIYSKVPVEIKHNTLIENGSCHSTWQERPCAGRAYAGIFLLNIPAGQHSILKKNSIVDQGLGDTTRQNTQVIYWMNFNTAADLTIKKNKFRITSKYIANKKRYNKEPRGLSVINPTSGINPKKLFKQNDFDAKFGNQKNVFIDNAPKY